MEDIIEHHAEEKENAESGNEKEQGHWLNGHWCYYSSSVIILSFHWKKRIREQVRYEEDSSNTAGQLKKDDKRFR